MDQWHAGPFCGADGSEVPFLALYRRVEQRAAVACTLQCDDHCLRRHVVQVTQTETERPIDLAADLQPERLRIEPGHLKMIAHVKARIRHDDAADERGERRFAVERVRSMD